MSSRFTYVWEFEVPATMEREFLRHYGPAGGWVALFRRAPGYVETLLLKDESKPGRYLTLDRWESEQAYRAFREHYGREYAAMDQSCEGLASRETPLGSFSEI
jgi:heme-degrading monooxygenase HmoA